MAHEDNFFALLGDEEGDDVSKLIDRVKQEKEKTNSSMEEKVQKENKEEKMIAHQIPTDMRAKRLVLPSHVRRSFIVFDKKKEREKAEAEARRKAKDSVGSNGKPQGDSDPIVAANDKSREQPVKGNFISLDNSNEGQYSTSFNSNQGGHSGGNGYHRKNGGSYNYKRNNGGANVYQQSNGYNGFYEGNYRRANGYRPKNSDQYIGSYKGFNGNQRHNRKNDGVSNGDQLNKGGDSNGNVADDGWKCVGRGRRNNIESNYQEHLSHEQDGIKNESLEASKKSEMDSGKSVNGDKNDDIDENKDLTGQQAVENEVEGHLSVNTEGQDDAKSRKKSKEKNKKKETEEIFEKKNEKKEHERKNLMTLEEYEKNLEDRKNLEALKRPEQRKVEDKDFESMQLIGKKKEDSLLRSEDKLKKKDNIKEEKVRKTLSISEFLKPVVGKTPYMRQRPYGDRPCVRHDIEKPNSKGNGERHYGEWPSGRCNGGARPNGMGDEDRSNGRFGGERPNNERDGDSERPSGHGPGPSPPPAPPSPSFEFEHHQFPALRGNGKA
ncbi:hypothetical protein REPUB_Repub12eG0080200 [Reevesia pubescens]